jgi:fatty-acyl-CoA synthase
VLEGLMQHDFPLTLGHILKRMHSVYADSQVVTVTDSGPSRASYGEVADRVDRLCGALRSLGIGEGDRVATFSWNTQEHFELYLAAPCMGAVLHTLNIRLPSDQLTYIANHAEDQIVFVDGSLVSLLEGFAPDLKTVKQYVIIGDADTSLPNAVGYEELLNSQPTGFSYPRLDERAAAGLCYTSGTTGNPKGVLYSHRSNVLHAMALGMTDTLGLCTADRALPIVPMFHANAWGTPYASALLGADLVMPSRFIKPDVIASLIEAERVTFAAAVPTIWLDLLTYADEQQPDLSSLRMVMCGGAAVPLSLMRDLEKRHNVSIIQGWGMTETSPVGSIARPPEGVTEDAHWQYRSSAGRAVPLVEARLVDDSGEAVRWDGESTGELEVRGPWVASDYYNDPTSPEKFDSGWLRTGDVAAITSDGFIKITDRAKDVIKSGGEWISSIEVETQLMAHPAVFEACVVAKSDDRWGERPLACIVVKEGESITQKQLREHLLERLAKWWVPDEFAFISEVPKTSVGKFDKKVLRQQLAEQQPSQAHIAQAQ